MKTEENIKAVELLHLMCSTAIGPRGKLKVIQNNCGGPVTVTSSSMRLLKNVRFTNPVVKIITSTALIHLQNQTNDGGLYLMVLASELLLKLWQICADVPQIIVGNVFDGVSKRVIEHLKSECNFKFQVSFDCLKIMLAILNTVFSSKPCCQLSRCERKHVVGLALKAFLQSLPNNLSTDAEVSIGTLHYVLKSDTSPEESRLMPGLIFSQQDLDCSSTIDKKLFEENAGKELVCALFRVSLSGDADVGSLSEAQWSIDGGVKTVIEACTAQIMNLSKQIIAAGVKVVACQKVIHPRVKKYLKTNGVITFDRIGQISFNAFVDLTGAVPIESFIKLLDKSCLGKVDSLSSVTLHERVYLYFQRSCTSVYTLFLCNYLEEGLEELNTVFRQGVATLRGLLHTPYVFYGGGCLEIHLATFIKGLLNDDLFQPVLNSNKRWQVLKVLETIAICFEQVAVHLKKISKSEIRADNEKQHFWSTELQCSLDQKCNFSPIWDEATSKCACGLLQLSEFTNYNVGGSSGTRIDDRCLIEPIMDEISDKIDAQGMKLDSFFIKMNAMKSALEVTGIILKVDNIIK